MEQFWIVQNAIRCDFFEYLELGMLDKRHEN